MLTCILLITLLSIVMAHLDLGPLSPMTDLPREPEDLCLQDEAGELGGRSSAPAPARELSLQRITGDGAPAPAHGRAERGHTLAVEVPDGAASLVVLALDAEGQVLASSDLELDTAVSTDVFLDLLASGLAAEGLESVDLRVRITPEVAAALAAAVRAAQQGHRGARPCASAPVGSRRR